MMVDAKNYKYAVVQFLQRPCEDIDKIVCIPHSWIRIRRVTEEKSIIAYPNERPSVTKRRIQDEEQPSEKWSLYLALVKLETYTYEDAKYYILEKKYGVAADDLSTSVGNGKNNPKKLPQISELQLEITMDKLKVVKGTNGSSSPNKISAENTSNLPTKDKPFVYPYLQQIPDYCNENSPENDCEDMAKNNSYISRDLLNSMKQHLLKSSNQNQVINTNNNNKISKLLEVDQDNPQVLPTEIVSEESLVAELPQLSLDDTRSQDLDIQPMIVDEPEVTEDTMEVSLAQNDGSDRSCSPEVSTEETNQPVDYPIDKVRIKANFISNILETMEINHLNSSERILEVYKSFKQSIELLKLIKNSHNNKKLELQKKEQAEIKTPDVEMRNDNARSSSNDEDEDDSEDENKKVQKKSRNLRNFVLPPEYDPKDTRWTLKYPKNDPEIGLVELVPGSKVFVDSIKLAHCKRVSKDCKTLARMLLAEIFSHSALAVCSLTGAKANAFHNNGTYVRPGLDANARMTMLAYVEDYARKKEWAAYDKQSVINSIRSRVQEIRAKHART